MLLLYTVTIFLGAFLLFLVQPMAARAILPALGGSPAVWNTCMVFFQVALLAGYAYAHGLVRIRRARVWVGVQAVVVLLPLLMLGRAIPSNPGAPPLDNPVPWLLVLLATTVGPFFVVLSTTGPLLQRWFGATDHPHAPDPYFLYAASNAGSLLALLAYPAVVEPNLGLPAQARLLAGGYVAYAALVVACGAMLLRRPAARGIEVPSRQGTLIARGAQEAPVAHRTRLFWIALAFVPSSLVLGVTQYLSTDLAAVPLLWVVPLAIYLLTFVMAFASRQVLSVRVASVALPIAVLTLVGTMLFEVKTPLGLLIALHLVVLFLAAFACHRQLAQGRPSAARLTEFYLLIALGGALGGVFNALIAPRVFTFVAEYPIALVLACLMCPAAALWPRRTGANTRMARLIGLAMTVLPAGLLGLVLVVSTEEDRAVDLRTIIPWVIASLVTCVLLLPRPRLFAAALSLLLLVAALRADPVGKLMYAERTFFGVLRVYANYKDTWVELRHGTTRHGLQANDERWRHVPTMYYHPASPIGDVFRLRTGTEGFDQCAFVGLGAGTLAAYGRPGMVFTFYEIDPAVVRIATDTRLFHYIDDSQAKVGIVLGDARLSIAEAPNGEYDLIVLDAFSSDAVPVHLITKEAISLYLSKCAPGGILAFHISSRYLELRPVLGAAARDLHLAAMVRVNDEMTKQEASLGASVSLWAVLARTPGDLAFLADQPGWKVLPSDPSFRAWTDDYSNILGVFGIAPP